MLALAVQYGQTVLSCLDELPYKFTLKLGFIFKPPQEWLQFAKMTWNKIKKPHHSDINIDWKKINPKPLFS